MKNSKLIQLLRTLDEKDWSNFLGMLSVSEYNPDERIVRLMEYLLLFAPDFDSDLLDDDEAAHAHIFPGATYEPNKRAVTKLCFRMLKMLEGFVSTQRHLNDRIQVQFNLLGHYWDSKDAKAFHGLSKKIRKELDKDMSNPKSYYHAFRLEMEIGRVASATKDKGKGDGYLLAPSEALDRFYFYQKLVYACQLINRNEVLGETIAKSMGLGGVLDRLEDTPYYALPEIRLWHQAYLLLSSPMEAKEKREALFNQIKKTLFSGNIPCDVEHTILLIIYLENYLAQIHKSEADRTILYESLNEFYKLRERLDDKGDYILGASAGFKNVITVRIALGEIAQAEMFYKKYGERMSLTHPETAQICQAMILFEKGEWDEVMEILNTLNPSHLFIKLTERRLWIKMFYEQGEFDLLEAHVNSFRVFLTSNQDGIRGVHLQGNRKFLSIVMQMARAKLMGQKLHGKILGVDGLTQEAAWINRKLQ